MSGRTLITHHSHHSSEVSGQWQLPPTTELTTETRKHENISLSYRVFVFRVFVISFLRGSAFFFCQVFRFYPFCAVVQRFMLLEPTP